MDWTFISLRVYAFISKHVCSLMYFLCALVIIYLSSYMEYGIYTYISLCVYMYIGNTSTCTSLSWDLGSQVSIELYG